MIKIKKPVKFKKRTIEEIINYHLNLSSSPATFGIKYGGPKHAYSVGFCQEILGQSHYQDYYKDTYGQKSAIAYGFGRARARKLLRKKKY